MEKYGRFLKRKKVVFIQLFTCWFDLVRHPSFDVVGYSWQLAKLTKLWTSSQTFLTQTMERADFKFHTSDGLIIYIFMSKDWTLLGTLMLATENDLPEASLPSFFFRSLLLWSLVAALSAPSSCSFTAKVHV